MEKMITGGAIVGEKLKMATNIVANSK